ncbi:cbb3-type cytochrome c oxidase subunit I [Bowmanella dokdonensis]|uniref:Cbb3-type cytochrome c oxidase subunit I n=1 Tax=Bowmanella dokdonensis TaxID=751969 RepID=A0A939DP34_9ALTE|nr:cbb3-type cytochrome c oxidase subunit I [Bowmanella dokdonensis]MBN7826192.1 cbb3-type cytochrome c oxidase subunit I [Bowmanella dokdonensis]
MTGRLSWEALPTYGAIVTFAAVLVLSLIVMTVAYLTWTGKWGYLWREWLTSLSHKRIGIMYIIIAFVMMLRALLEAMLMRAQQAVALNNPGFVDAEHFHQLFSTHGTVMIFFVLMPFITGLINKVLPLQIGARDMAFPWLNAVSLWLTASGAGLVIMSLLLGRFSTGGWSGYPPYTGIDFSPGTGVDYWIWALALSSISTTLSGINFLVTITKRRCPGMGWMRLPLFVWTTACSSILIIFAFPSLSVATLLLALDRTLDMHFFTNDLGGNMMHYVNLFWLWGHPEVYILILPAFGVFSEVIATFSSKTLFGYRSLVYATVVITLLSFTVWLHHFFTMGSSASVNAFFGIMTMVIAVPTGVKIYDWIFTLYRGRIRFSVPMLYALAFIMTFVLGGVSGVLLAIPPFDYVVHNSAFLVAHFHNMLIPGTLFGMMAGYTYWFPKATGFRLDEYWGRLGFYGWLVGFYLAFMPLYLLGLMGMPRRLQQYDQPEWQPLLIVAGAGALIILLGALCQLIQLIVSIRRRRTLADRTGDPWDARTLEWTIASPPPEWNFSVIPNVDERDPFAAEKGKGHAYPLPARKDYQDIELPRNNGLPFVLGVLSFWLGFALVWHLWWLAILTLLGSAGCLARRSFQRDSEKRISAENLYQYDRKRHQQLQKLAGHHALNEGFRWENKVD